MRLFGSFVEGGPTLRARPKKGLVSVRHLGRRTCLPVKRPSLPFALPVACVLGGCGTEPTLAERTSEEIVITQYDPAANFQSPTTFAVVPTVSLVTDTGDGGRLEASDSQQILDRIAAHLEERGYVQVEPSALPDLGVNATALVTIRVETTVVPGYWWGSPGFVGTPTFWGYPSGAYGFPWGYTSTAYRSGTLVVEIVDLRSVRSGLPPESSAPDAGTIRLPVVWTATLHGYVALSGSLVPDALASIDQAFAQSPYLRKQ